MCRGLYGTCMPCAAGWVQAGLLAGRVPAQAGSRHAWAPACVHRQPATSAHPLLQYFGNDGASRSSRQRSQSPPDSKDSASGSGDEGESDGMSSHGSGPVEVSDAARQIASAMCAAQQLPGEPPQQVRWCMAGEGRAGWSACLASMCCSGRPLILRPSGPLFPLSAAAGVGLAAACLRPGICGACLHARRPADARRTILRAPLARLPTPAAAPAAEECAQAESGWIGAAECTAAAHPAAGAGARDEGAARGADQGAWHQLGAGAGGGRRGGGSGSGLCPGHFYIGCYVTSLVHPHLWCVCGGRSQ